MTPIFSIYYLRRPSWYVLAVILMLAALCNCTSQNPPGQSPPDSLKSMDADAFLRTHPDYCSPLHLEVTGIYPPVDSMPAGTDDSCFLDNVLKAQGWVQTDYGWGNWTDGPRIIEMTLVQGKCTCVVYKKYYAAEAGNDTAAIFRITEELHCGENNP